MAAVDLKEIERLLNQVAYASSKKAGEADATRLEFLASSLRAEVSGYTAGKLDQAINHAKAASGQVKDKDHQLYRMQNAWHVFSSDVKNDESNT